EDMTYLPTASGLVRAQEAEKLGPFSQPAPRHLPAREHLPNDLPDLGRSEVEALIKHFHAVENLLLRQMRVADRGELHALLVDQVVSIAFLQTALGHLLFVERGAGVGRG